MQPEERREDKLSSTKEESGWDKQDEGVLEAARPAKSFALKELLEMLHDTEHAEDKILGADPNSEGGGTAHQGVEKMLSPYCQRYFNHSYVSLQRNETL